MNLGAEADMRFGGQKIGLRLNLNNIFDETYLDHLSTLTGTGYYNIGRNFTVSLKIPFG
jgi:iron complex outermembrane receptor protein